MPLSSFHKMFNMFYSEFPQFPYLLHEYDKYSTIFHTFSQFFGDMAIHVYALSQSVVPGPPFAFGAILVILALLVAVFMPENPHGSIQVGKPRGRRQNSITLQAFGLENGM